MRKVATITLFALCFICLASAVKASADSLTGSRMMSGSSASQSSSEPPPPTCPTGMYPIKIGANWVCVSIEEDDPGYPIPPGTIIRFRVCVRIGREWICGTVYYICNESGCHFEIRLPSIPGFPGTIKCTYEQGPPMTISCDWKNLKCTLSNEGGGKACWDCGWGPPPQNKKDCTDINDFPLWPDIVPLLPGMGGSSPEQ